MLTKPEMAYTKSLWAVRSLEKPQETSDDIILRVNGVDASYGGSIKVLEDVTMDIRAGPPWPWWESPGQASRQRHG